MRMTIADYLRAAAACETVRVDERLRIDFEMAPAVGGSVRCRSSILDRAIAAEQDSAAFVGRSLHGLCLHAIERCPCDAKPHFPSM